MNKTDTTKLLNKIKGYYNSQFFVDENVIEAWYETLKPYNFEDAIDHIQEYVKDNLDNPPKPQTFIKGLLTQQQKENRKNSSFTVECNLCHRWMTLEEYDEHYERCLDIQYLEYVAKVKGEEFTRKDLENCRQDVIQKLLKKYPPEEMPTNELFNIS